jgi:hypothetical protein
MGKNQSMIAIKSKGHSLSFKIRNDLILFVADSRKETNYFLYLQRFTSVSSPNASDEAGTGPWE